MSRRSDDTTAGWAGLAAALAAASATLAVLGAAASLLWALPAQAQPQPEEPCGVAALPEDEGLDAALEHHQQGHPEQAARVLERLAAAGNVVAMERLALMHWYGKALYGAGPWQRAVGAWWFERAAQQGSVLGGHMRGVVRRAGVAAAPAPCGQPFPGVPG